MGALIGNLMMVVVLVVVSFFVTSYTAEVEEAAIDGIRYRAGKKAMLGIAAVLDQDLRNVGSNFPSYYDFESKDAIAGYDTTSAMRYFEFFGQVRAGEMPVMIRYQWNVIDSVEVEGTVRPVFELRRFVNGGAAGRSSALLTRVSLVLTQADGSPIAALEEARQIAVELEGFSALGRDRFVELTRWNGVYRPTAITRDDFDAL